MPFLLEHFHNPQFLLGRNTGIYPDFLHLVRKAAVIQRRQLLPGYHQVIFAAQNPDALGNGFCRQRMVAGYHYGYNASRFALGYRVKHFFTGRINDAGQPQKPQTGFLGFAIHIFRQRIPIAAGKPHYPQSLGRQAIHLLLQHGHIGIRTPWQQDIGSAFGEGNDFVTVGMEGRHHFPVGIKRNFRQPWPYARLYVLFPCHFHQGNLRAVAFDVFATLGHGIIVQGKRVQQQVNFFLLPDGRQCVSFVQLPICKHLFQVHFVFGERAGFVSADVRDRPQGFHGRQLPDEAVEPDHSFRGQCQGNGDDGGQRFRYGGHGE